MYRAVVLAIMIVLSLSLTACNLSQPRSLPIEMVAYGGLSDKERGLVPVSPKDSTVEKVDVTAEIKLVVDSSYSKKQVYAVTFNRTVTNSAQNLVVYVSLNGQTIVGKNSNGK